VLFCNVVQPSLRPFWTVAAFQVSWQWTSVRGACKILGNNPMHLRRVAREGLHSSQ
jgi:hypothetical protein